MVETPLQSEPPFQAIPGGSWSTRDPSFRRSLFALFRKQFRIKLRSFAALFELLVAFSFYFILWPIDTITIAHYDEDRVPRVRYFDPYSADIFKFILWSNQSRVAAMPRNPRTVTLMNMFSLSFLSQTSIVPEYATTVDELQRITYGFSRTGTTITGRV
jgi:hypothetical protein